MRRKSVKNNDAKRQKIAIVAFILCVILAGAAFYYIWQGQTYGKTVEGVLKLAQIWEKRKALESEQPAVVSEVLQIDARSGCCVWLERPSISSQLLLNVPASSKKCYEDPIVRQQVERGYVIIDITSGRCPK